MLKDFAEAIKKEVILAAFLPMVVLTLIAPVALVRTAPIAALLVFVFGCLSSTWLGRRLVKTGKPPAKVERWPPKR